MIRTFIAAAAVAAAALGLGSAVASAQPVYYKNCDAARAAGADPVMEGNPGYGPHLDRDSDGIGCE